MGQRGGESCGAPVGLLLPLGKMGLFAGGGGHLVQGGCALTPWQPPRLAQLSPGRAVAAPLAWQHEAGSTSTMSQQQHWGWL